MGSDKKALKTPLKTCKYRHCKYRHCEKEFIPERWTQKYCCPEHASLEEVLRQRERYRSKARTKKKGLCSVPGCGRRIGKDLIFLCDYHFHNGTGGADEECHLQLPY